MQMPQREPAMQPGMQLASRATPERLAKAGRHAVEITPPAKDAPKGTQRLSDAPLDRLWKSSFITRREYDNGDRLRADAYLAAIDPGANTVNWDATGGGFSSRVPSMFSSQTIADARMRFRRLKQAIGGVVWDVLNLAVIHERDLAEIGLNVFKVRDQREAHIAGKVATRMALGSLADAYERGA